MNDVAYKEYPSPYTLNKEVVDALSYLSTKYFEDEDELADVIPYPEGLISGLRRKRYVFRDVAAVTDFLEEHPFLIQVLFRAHKEIRDIFGPLPRLALRVVADPEAQEERELFLFIQTRLHPKAARALLNELHRKWWLDAMLDAKGEMNISLEYVCDH